MGNVSSEWLAAISKGRDYSIDDMSKEHSVPIFPWLHPPLDSVLRDLIKKLGLPRELCRQEKVFQPKEKIAGIVLVTAGVIARNFGIEGIGPKAAAISTPGHIGSGNLNFLTGRPACGSYFALTKAKVVFCPKDVLLPVLSSDKDLLMRMLKHLETCTLSDRMGFALMAFAPVELRLKAFVVSWAVHYGKILKTDGQTYVKVPVPLTRNNRCLVANASALSTDKCLKAWKESGMWQRDGDFITFPTAFVEDAYSWMRNSEENSAYTYPETFEKLMTSLPELTNPWY